MAQGHKHSVEILSGAEVGPSREVTNHIACLG